MSTVLAYTSPAAGHLFPMTPLLLELAARGHDVHVRTLASRVDLVRALGLAATAIDPRIERIALDDWRTANQVRALAASTRAFAARARFDAPDLQAALDEVRPDVVIVDTNAWGACFAAEAWGGPWLMFSPFTPPLSSRGLPPFGPGLLPMHGPLGRLRDAVARPLVLGAAERAMLPPLNSVRAGLHLPALRSADDYYRGAPLLLLATAEPFEYHHEDWGERVVMTGAMPWEPASATPEWLDELDGPLALVTTSSEYQGDERLVRTALEALADEPLTVVATMPAGVRDIGPVPGNARVLQFVPHAQVLPKAVVAITHGGMGATQKALSHGVPACVVPFGRDQLEVAARVVHADAGTRVPRRTLGAAALREAVRVARTKRVGAGRVAAGFRAAGGAPAGADAVEMLVNGGSR